MNLTEIKKRYPAEKPICFNYMQAREDVFSLCNLLEQQAGQIQELQVVPQPIPMPETKAMEELAAEQQAKRDASPVMDTAAPPVVSPLVKQKGGTRRKKPEKEVLSEGEQLRFDGYLFEPQQTQMIYPDVPNGAQASEALSSETNSESASGVAQKISKPTV